MSIIFLSCLSHHALYIHIVIWKYKLQCVATCYYSCCITCCLRCVEGLFIKHYQSELHICCLLKQLNIFPNVIYEKRRRSESLIAEASFLHSKREIRSRVNGRCARCLFFFTSFIYALIFYDALSFGLAESFFNGRRAHERETRTRSCERLGYLHYLSRSRFPTRSRCYPSRSGSDFSSLASC